MTAAATSLGWAPFAAAVVLGHRRERLPHRVLLELRDDLDAIVDRRRVEDRRLADRGHALDVGLAQPVGGVDLSGPGVAEAEGLAELESEDK